MIEKIWGGLQASNMMVQSGYCRIPIGFSSEIENTICQSGINTSSIVKYRLDGSQSLHSNNPTCSIRPVLTILSNLAHIPIQQEKMCSLLFETLDQTMGERHTSGCRVDNPLPLTIIYSIRETFLMKGSLNLNETIITDFFQ